MKKILTICLLLFAVAIGPSAQAADTPPTILVLGDSLSAAYGIPQEAGWVLLLEDRLADRGYPHALFNASISGETTAGGLRRLPALLDKHRPEIVILELGANDGLRALSLKTMQKNLQQMVQASTEAGARVLLLGMRIPQNYGAVHAEGFHAVYSQVAKEPGVTRVDFFLAPIALNQDYFQADRLHPNVKAQPLLLDELWDELKSMLEETDG